MYRRLITITVIFVIFGIIWTVYKSTRLTFSPPLQNMVSTSFYPLYYFTTQIAGDKLIINNITPPGVEPHDFEPTLQDILSIQKSRLLILNGGTLETWINDLEQELKEGTTQIIVTGEGLFADSLEDGGQIPDPHIWLNPNLAKKQAERIARTLIELYPEHKAEFENRTEELAAKLTALDQKYREGLKNCQKKEIITSHIAFSYLAEEYGFKQIAIRGISPDEEPSPQELAKIAQFAKNNNIQYIFFESLVTPEFSETIAQEIGAKTLVLNPLEGLTHEEIAQGKNYFTEMENNLTNLKIALACQ